MISRFVRRAIFPSDRVDVIVTMGSPGNNRAENRRRHRQTDRRILLREAFKHTPLSRHCRIGSPTSNAAPVQTESNPRRVQFGCGFWLNGTVVQNRRTAQPIGTGVSAAIKLLSRWRKSGFTERLRGTVCILARPDAGWRKSEQKTNAKVN